MVAGVAHRVAVLDHRNPAASQGWSSGGLAALLNASLAAMNPPLILVYPAVMKLGW
jgi:hypothetical protein